MAATLAEIIGTRELATVTPGMTVREACRVLERLNVGAAVVLDNERLVGILSERDVIRKCICKSRPTAETAVREIMTPNPTVIAGNDNPTVALHMMISGHFRHLPVIDGGRCIGIVSLREIPIDNHVMYQRYHAALSRQFAPAASR